MNTDESTINKKFECALGCHEYSIPHEGNEYIKICKHCKRKGHFSNHPNCGNYEVWYDFDEKGGCVYRKDNEGEEIWFDDRGIEICCKFPRGDYEWLDNNGNMVNEKPKNWKYEKFMRTVSHVH